MKHHIAVKFLAVVLAAVSLLAAVAGGAGITVLTAADLYDNSVDEVYAEKTAAVRRDFAVRLAHRYACLTLGNLPEAYVDQYYGDGWYDTFRYGSYYYAIVDETGTVVEYTVPQSLGSDAVGYDIMVTDIRYRSLTEPLVPETTAPAPGLPGTENGEETQPTEPPVPADPELYRTGYYDDESDTYVEFYYQYADLPPYTVQLYLLPGAMPEEPVWEMLKVVWEIRYALFYVLGGGLLLAAVFLVYLCCAAGKKPGREEIRAGGINCFPLDLYLGCAGLGGLLLMVFGYEVAEELIRHRPSLFLPFLLFAGFFLCLAAVSFLFACAAQFKTPGGYWWRNSVVGRCLLLLGKLPPVLRKLIRVLWRWTRNILALLRRILLAVIRKIHYALSWIGKRLVRFYGMLPLTWQWLLVGMGMLIMVILTMQSRNKLLVLLPLGVSLGIVLYGTSAFGILLESARRMRSGDLESKVSDQFLIGSFKDFAGELNGLADVAVVAARKQLKSERMKTELITNVSHDIKTPLTSLINYVDLLQKPHTPEEGEQYLEVLSRQSQRLKKLVEDLMEMSKASTGNIAVEPTRMDAVEAVNQALGEFADKLEKARLTPVFRQPEKPVFILADGRLLWRVLSNLLSNAVKYALPGTRVYLDLVQEDGNVILSLKNISRESLNVSADELLERFVRGDASRNTEGSGLGLNIARSLMEVQKGSLELTVDGDLFKVTLRFPGA